MKDMFCCETTRVIFHNTTNK